MEDKLHDFKVGERVRIIPDERVKWGIDDNTEFYYEYYTFNELGKDLIIEDTNDMNVKVHPVNQDHPTFWITHNLVERV